MPLTLEQYATYLDTRDLPWPSPPTVERPKAKPHFAPLPEVRAVLWNVYGTLLNLTSGELCFEHPQPLITSVALDKTLQEFKMWASMSRKPGQPAEYLGQIYQQVLLEQQMSTVAGEKYPEPSAEKVWESIIKKLFVKDYQFDAAFYGSLNEFSRKVAYFFHASLQATECYPGAAKALHHVARRKSLKQGLLADGQCFTLVQLQRGLTAQDENAKVDDLIGVDSRWLSHELRAKKPSDRLFRAAVDGMRAQGIEPKEILHVGTRISQDVVPAKRVGMRTALFAGDRASLQATPEQLKDPLSRPDVMLTKLKQIMEVV
jgi:FMN phosphatase YigB (HAD superfamily)